MKLSIVLVNLLLIIVITTSNAFDLDYSESSGNVDYLNEADWRSISVDDSILKTIINATLPTLARRNLTKLLTLEAIISASKMETLDLSGGYRYFVKAIFEETSCSLDTHNHNKECSKQNITGSSKLCTIQLYYAPKTNQFGKNIVRCWELKSALNDSLINKAIETSLTLIGQQLGKPDSVTLKEIDRAYFFSFVTSKTWFDKKYYLKLKINSPSNETSEILTCSGEIDLASILPDSFMSHGFHCQ